MYILTLKTEEALFKSQSTNKSLRILSTLQLQLFHPSLKILTFVCKSWPLDVYLSNILVLWQNSIWMKSWILNSPLITSHISTLKLWPYDNWTWIRSLSMLLRLEWCDSGRRRCIFQNLLMLFKAVTFAKALNFGVFCAFGNVFVLDTKSVVFWNVEN